MNIFPAIDMLDGQAVRLYQGDYKQSEIVAANIVDQARAFEAEGAKWLHLVDLDGAKEGSLKNFSYVQEIKESTQLNVQLGGGIREIATLEKLFETGVDRAILGTAAVKDPEFLKTALDKYGDKIAVGIDVLEGQVKVSGWLESTERYLDEFAESMEKLGVSTLIVTDIAKDGAMEGTNLNMMAELSQNLSLQLIASGGVSSMEDLQALKESDIYGAIIGKALYNGTIALSDALSLQE